MFTTYFLIRIGNSGNTESEVQLIIKAASSYAKFILIQTLRKAPKFVQPLCITWILFAFFSTQSIAATTPQNFRASVYSQSTLELFWSQSNSVSGITGYELHRNTETIWLGNVTSYLDTNLKPGQIYHYNVVAHALNGTTSETGSQLQISVSPAGSIDCPGSNYCASIAISDNQLQTSQPSNAPSQSSSSSASLGASSHVLPLSGGRVEIYSSSAAELFWNRPDNASGISAFQVYRDGVLLGQTDGISFFDGNLVPSVNHHYQVFALHTDGIPRRQSISINLDGDIQTNNLSSETLSVSSALIGSSGTTTSSITSTSLNSSNSMSSSNISENGEVTNSASSSQSGNSGPTNLNGTVYSSSALELFWNYPNTADFNIYQNGRQLTTTRGRSHYIEGLNSKTTYRYEVVARDWNTGASVSFGTITLTTP